MTKYFTGRTEQGKHFQHMLLLELTYFGPYSEVKGEKLVRERNVDVGQKAKTTGERGSR